MNLPARTIRAIVARFPAVVLHLKGRARWIAYTADVGSLYDKKDGGFCIPKSIAYNEWLRLRDIKSVEFFQRTLERMVTNVYNNQIAGEFIDIMANLISGQLTQAFEQAWKDEEGEGGLPDYLTSAAEDMILNQYDFVDQFYRDIVNARVDETPIDPLLARAPLWAQRWTEAYNTAVSLIVKENGGNLMWELGETEQHCESCSALNGIVARASEWEELGVHPQGAPNDALECGGWQCDCRLSPTDKRRSPDAYGRIMNVVTK